MMKRTEIEIIARGVCVKRGRVLLCHTKGADNTYLPGGHVEFGEPAAESLRREIKEELGRGANVGRFLGAVEHAYRRKGKPCCEVNLVFEAGIAGVSPRRVPRSREDYIEFLWAPLDGLAAARLEPGVLCRLLPAWLRRRREMPRWASTY
jgi:8-oxo-dGTP diphosphatase